MRTPLATWTSTALPVDADTYRDAVALTPPASPW